MEHVKVTDSEIAELIELETARQRDKIRLIPSENYVSSSVLEVSGSVLTNKYSEGYAKKRYYEGQQYIDQIEQLAIQRAKSLFGAEAANVQPYSGSPANLAVYFAFAQPGDPIMGLALDHGGHLTHGWGVSITGAYYTPIRYELNPDTHLIDYDMVRDLAKKHRPKIIMAGATAYPRIIDFNIFAEVAREVDALLCVDMAHIAGLVAGGAHPSPVPLADVVTTTTHKSLRGPRGGMILMKKKHRKAINKAVFPGLQGGPHNHTTAGIAVALKEAATEEFKTYAHNIVANAKHLAEKLNEKGFKLVSGGTDNHLVLIDVSPRNVTGKVYAKALDTAGIVCNYNTVPFDPRPPFDPSGIRIGTPSMTSRGMGKPEMEKLADWMDQVANNVENESELTRIAGEVKELCKNFPAPGIPA
ncbi:MAG: serine hydroxymethyltransferase [Deltaproteobacteria bacterium]|nr:serine hydroxymethyltransferase [Deltaproteobacteria bacterium]MBN2674265.1 serine hydroxymethyltransferase [Deltaproteobacteria bacterium]